GEADLVAHAVDGVFADAALADHLERDADVELAVVDFEDLAHAAAAEQADDVIAVADRRAEVAGARGAGGTSGRFAHRGMVPALSWGACGRSARRGGEGLA